MLLGLPNSSNKPIPWARLIGAYTQLAHLDTTVWWRCSTGLIALVALEKLLELRYDLLPAAALSYFLPHEIGRDARSELLLFSFR